VSTEKCGQQESSGRITANSHLSDQGIGIDLGKTTFHLVGLNAAGEVVVRRKFSRTQLLRFTANLRVRLIGMEACGGSHFLCRSLREQGHEVRLMPEQYVKPYVKTNKNDYIDAEAIAEAVGRPRMRFVPIKSDDQLDMQSLHCVRDRWVAHRTARLGNRSGDSHNRRPATTGFTRFCQVCWRKQRWQNGRTRRSRNLKLRQALQGCEIN
jgi:transposase